MLMDDLCRIALPPFTSKTAATSSVTGCTVVTVVEFVDLEGHLDRLNRSLGELQIDWPVARNVLKIIMRQLLAGTKSRTG